MRRQNKSSWSGRSAPAAWGSEMKKDTRSNIVSKSRRKFLKNAGAAAAAVSFGAVPLRGWAADPINIGGLYPTTGSMAQIGVGCVAAAKLAVEMINNAGGIKSLGGAKLNLITSDVQSDTTVTRTETDRLITSNKLSAIHGCFASARRGASCHHRQAYRGGYRLGAAAAAGAPGRAGSVRPVQDPPW